MPQPERLQELLDLQWPPATVTFAARPPEGMVRVAPGAPAGCGYWKRAAEGEVFYTEAADHHGCPVGAYTHGVELPPETAAELEELVRVMTGLEYIAAEEVATIPRRTEPLHVAVYAPLGGVGNPDVILVRGNARQIMLLTEAARAAGVGPDASTMGRPACAVVPETLKTGQAATSLGCIGNRVYTELGDDEFYLSLPGGKLDVVAEKLETIVRANRELEAFHRARQAG
jgi:uncharacterized protein (DUF169 family)